MASRSQWRRWVLWASLGLATVGLALFLIALGLERANQTAGVLSLFASLAGVVVAVSAYRADRRVERTSPRDSAESNHTGDSGIHNEISGGHFHGTVIQAGRINSLDQPQQGERNRANKRR